MSHFTLMVIGPETKEEIDAALAPFDENMEVEPYRSYEKGDAEDYWFVRSVRRDAQHFREGTGLEEGDLRRRCRTVPRIGRARGGSERRRSGATATARRWARRSGAR